MTGKETYEEKIHSLINDVIFDSALLSIKDRLSVIHSESEVKRIRNRSIGGLLGLVLIIALSLTYYVSRPELVKNTKNTLASPFIASDDAEDKNIEIEENQMIAKEMPKQKQNVNTSSTENTVKNDNPQKLNTIPVSTENQKEESVIENKKELIIKENNDQTKALELEAKNPVPMIKAEAVIKTSITANLSEKEVVADVCAGVEIDALIDIMKSCKTTIMGYSGKRW